MADDLRFQTDLSSVQEATPIDLGSEAEKPKMSRKRKLALLGLAGIIAKFAVVGGFFWVVEGMHVVATDNAYVGADSAKVSPLAGGPVSMVNVSDTESVRAGQVLVRLDDTDARIAHAQAKAEMAKAQADYERARIDLNRRQALASSGSVSAEELTAARNNFAAAEAGREVAHAKLASAKLTLDRMTIVAPIDGVVTAKKVEIGQRVDVGTQLMTIVPISHTYVDANFKEGQLDRVRVGQPVELKSDLYGDDVVYHGKVSGLGGGTGSAFAIIPAQNATGNWIKVVQRVPVRITLDAEELRAHPLRVGLSMEAKIDTRKPEV